MATVEEDLELMKIRFDLLVLRCILALMRLRLLLEDLLDQLLLGRHGKLLVKVASIDVPHPLLSTCEVIVELHRRWLAAKTELPDKHVPQLLDVGDSLQITPDRLLERAR